MCFKKVGNVKSRVYMPDSNWEINFFAKVLIKSTSTFPFLKKTNGTFKQDLLVFATLQYIKKYF